MQKTYKQKNHLAVQNICLCIQLRYPAVPVNKIYRPRLYQSCNYFIRPVFKSLNETIQCFSQKCFKIYYVVHLYTLLNVTLNLLIVDAL